VPEKAAGEKHRGHRSAEGVVGANDLVDEDSAESTVRPLLAEAFPDGDRQNEILERALADVRKSRAVSTESLTPYLADIGDIERDLPIYEASLLREIDVDRFAQRDLRHRILNRVKNRVQTYLMSVEPGKDAKPPEPGGNFAE
jgi:hypothetical protein